VSFLFGLGLLILQPQLLGVVGADSGYEVEFWTRQFTLFGLLSLFSGQAITLFAYLRGDFSTRTESDAVTPPSDSLQVSSGTTGSLEGVEERLSFFTARVEERLSFLTAKVENLEKIAAAVSARESGISGEDRERLIAHIRSDAIAQLAKSIPEELTAKIAAEIPKRDAVERSRLVIVAARNRLELELAQLRRRGNVNLVIGSVTTCAAVALLYQTVAGVSQTFTTIPALLSFYIPRVSTAVFVEVFAFFFLRLYRNGLADMKYFHSELLTLDTRMAALDAAVAHATETAQSDILKLLAATDRTQVASSQVASSEKLPVEPKVITDLVEAALKASRGGK
jgi:hypothetical protein